MDFSDSNQGRNQESAEKTLNHESQSESNQLDKERRDTRDFEISDSQSTNDANIETRDSIDEGNPSDNLLEASESQGFHQEALEHQQDYEKQAEIVGQKQTEMDSLSGQLTKREDELKAEIFRRDDMLREVDSLASQGFHQEALERQQDYEKQAEIVDQKQTEMDSLSEQLSKREEELKAEILKRDEMPG